MLEVRDLLSFPPLFRDRNKTWKKLESKLLDFDDSNGKVILYGETNKHQQIIEIQGKKIHLNSEVKIYCDCQSFLYEFAHIINDNDSLYGKNQFEKALKLTPREKNRKGIISGCKHIIAFTNYIYRNSNRINNRL